MGGYDTAITLLDPANNYSVLEKFNDMHDDVRLCMNTCCYLHYCNFFRCILLPFLPTEICLPPDLMMEKYIFIDRPMASGRKNQILTIILVKYDTRLDIFIVI